MSRSSGARLGPVRRLLRLALAATCAAGLLLASALAALAATPTPAPGGDPRSSGQGPGLVGDPLFAVLVVLLIAAVTVVATLAYVRLTGGRRS